MINKSSVVRWITVGACRLETEAIKSLYWTLKYCKEKIDHDTREILRILVSLTEDIVTLFLDLYQNLTFVDDQYDSNNIAFPSIVNSQKSKKVTPNQHLQDSL